MSASAARRQSPSTPSRRTIALKRADGEPLTRADIQYDVLYSIFRDTHDVFTDPYPPDVKPPPKISFRDLYLKCILHSPKATKALKDKMSDSQTFAEDFGMLALLVNVGRINTTMSFFPEMKTAIRTYHPIPALQRTTGNLQDAPRIKHILKASILEGEQANMPSVPAEILARLKAGRIPSTTVPNLIFVMANHSAAISQAHFSNHLDFIDIFLRRDISSLSRAYAFLWLCYHYLEAPSSGGDDNYDETGPCNPFADHRRGNTPTFTFLSEAEIAQENNDPPEEATLAGTLVAQRAEILKSHEEKESNKALITASAMTLGGDEDGAPGNSESKTKGRRGAAKAKVGASGMKNATARSRHPQPKGKAVESIIAPEGVVGFDAVPPTAAHATGNQYPHHQYKGRLLPAMETHVQENSSLVNVESSGAGHQLHRHRFSPYNKSPYKQTLDRSQLPPPKLYSKAPRSLLQRKLSLSTEVHDMRSDFQVADTWHILSTRDPLLDSDNEMEVEGEHIRHDYIQRLRVISALRRKEPTPESERIVMQVALADPHGYLSD